MSVSGGFGKRPRGFDLDAAHAVDDARRVLQAGQERMPLAGGRVGFQTQIRILHRAFDAAFEGDAKEVRQAEVLSPHAPFVVETRFVRGDEAAAAARRTRGVARTARRTSAAMFGRMSVLNGPRCAASSSRSCTISKGMRASISA